MPTWPLNAIIVLAALGVLNVALWSARRED
jgi:hypothetical protein